MKKIRIFAVAAMFIATAQFSEAAPTLTVSPTETVQRRPPPPPDPLHLFKGRPRRRVVVHHPPRHRKIKLPHIKLPPPPPHP